MADNDLTDKQRRFVDEYLKDSNATQAAIRAGYEATNADVTGPRMLGNVGISLAIAERQTEVAAKCELSVQWVLDGLKENFNRAMQAEPVLDHEGSPTGEYRYEGAVANRALELVGNHLGMWVKRTEDVTKLTPEQREARVVDILKRRGLKIVPVERITARISESA
jgi:phage terminase small subunit